MLYDKSTLADCDSAKSLCALLYKNKRKQQTTQFVLEWSPCFNLILPLPLLGERKGQEVAKSLTETLQKEFK